MAEARQEQVWAGCCDAAGCSDAVRAQGWQQLQDLQRKVGILGDAQVSGSPRAQRAPWSGRATRVRRRRRLAMGPARRAAACLMPPRRAA